MYTIALFCDAHMLPGLHVTLLSMLRSLNAERAKNVEIFLFLDAVSKNEQELLIRTHGMCDKGSHLRLVDYSPKSPTGSDLLHGNATTYGRLSLPKLLPETAQCLYLDCDLIVNRCVTDLFRHFDGQHILLVDGTGKRNYSLDTALFERAGLDMAGACFNAGVMGIDLSLWREKNIASVVEHTAKEFQGMFASADQALLNVALGSWFKPIGDDYNTALSPSSPAVDGQERKIYHLIGSPKPWDFLGSISSNHYRMWKVVYRDTAISNKRPVRYSSLKRIFYTAKQTLKSVKSRIRHSTQRRSAPAEKKA